MDRTRPTFNGNSKANLLLKVEFLRDTRKSLLDIKSATTAGGPELLKRASSFFNDLPHYLQHMVQRGLSRQVLGQAINRDVQLHRGADNTL